MLRLGQRKAILGIDRHEIAGPTACPAGGRIGALYPVQTLQDIGIILGAHRAQGQGAIGLGGIDANVLRAFFVCAVGYRQRVADRLGIVSEILCAQRFTD